jgi:NADH-quinone oxidoreductase subunit L
MAGPTPVSALIHAATMVTAGIYLLVRSGPLLALMPNAQAVIACLGALTALWAALIAIGQSDIKRVLAYSTISQLGFMVAAVGVGTPVAAMFHLVTHAFFKALLFLAAGAVIQGLEADGHHGHGLQDMRRMGGLRQTMPLTFAAFTVGALALTGLPPLAGFFSKDEILVSAFAHNFWVYGLLTAATVCTAFYTGRQLGWVFFGLPRSAEARHATERPTALLWPLSVLATLSIISGALNWPGQSALSGWLNHTLAETTHIEFSWPIALTSVMLTLASLSLGAWVYGRAPLGDADPLARWLFVFQHAFWVDEIYVWAILRPYQRMSGWLADADRVVLNGLEQNLVRALEALAAGARRLQTGQLNWNMFGLVLGLMLTLLAVLWGGLQ